MEKLNEKNQTIIFKAQIEDSLANAIRRYVGVIPTLAIDEVEISKNNSPLYDETIAHRMGLISIKTEKIKADTSGEMTLKVKREGLVLAGDLEGDFEVVYKNTPITFLTGNQEMDIKATIKPGIGIDHSKFMPGLMFYRNTSEITLDNSLKKDVEYFCPGVSIKEKDSNIIIKDDSENEIADLLEGLGQKSGKDFSSKIGNELVITIESFGQIPSKDIFLKAIDALKKDLATAAKSFK